MVALSFYEALDTPRSLACSMLLKSGELEQLTQLACDPLTYLSAETYTLDAGATHFLRKCAALTIDNVDPASVAVLKWKAAEKQCAVSNHRLRRYEEGGPFSHPSELRFYSLIKRARSIIYKAIGSSPDFSRFEGKFGPGATLSDKARACSLPDKISSVPTSTADLKNHQRLWNVFESSKWADVVRSQHNGVCFEERGNTYFSVPKDATTDRGCGKEPSVNAFLQLGAGRQLRSLLKTCGLDLVNGQQFHKDLAQKASITGLLCTLDLSSASDTVCRVLVRLLLPSEWFVALEALRSKTTLLEGKVYILEKFSSMGNGFTFELETLLFTALSLAAMGEDSWVQVHSGNVSVYGDDIIVPTHAYDVVREALEFAGFTLNEKKSFHTGSFRESCGGDFFSGKAVRPHFLKEDPDEPQKLISLANGIRRFASQSSVPDSVSGRLRATWLRVLHLIPSSVRQCVGPEGLGDIVIHDDPSRWRIRWKYNKAYQRPIGYVRAYRPSKFRKLQFGRYSYDAQFAMLLYLDQGENSYFLPSSSDDDDRRQFLSRDAVLGYKVGWVSLGLYQGDCF